jgi:hypothetical protein
MQLGVGVKGGCEAAIHATRRFAESLSPDHVIVKLDFSNAFNSLHRDSILQSVRSKLPEIYAYCELSYQNSSVLQFGDYSITSEEGIQQGDPIGPFLFCLTLHPIIQSLSSELKVAYMDDITLGGQKEIVANDVLSIITNGRPHGIILNIDKCEQISNVPSTTLPIKDFEFITIENATLLGSPLTKGKAMDCLLSKRLNELRKIADRLRLISSHDAVTLLKYSCGSPKMLHMLRSSPCTQHPSLDDFDSVLRTCICNIANVYLNEMQWKQASLPVKAGGLGIRSVSRLSSPAFLASVSSTRHLQELLLDRHVALIDHHFDNTLSEWISEYNLPPPHGEKSHRQKSWDKPAVAKVCTELHSSAQDAYHTACLNAASAPHSGDWLHAPPIASCGLRLDNEAIRIAVCLRLGADLCEPHLCPCGAQVDARGSHGLSCKLCSGRTTRHAALNDLIWRALQRAGIPSVKEPSGLLRTDGKRPDGLTLIPWQAGRTVIWDSTVIHTLADSYLATSATTPGGTAEIAANRKESKYSALSTTHMFVPVAVESLGPICAKGTNFLRDLGSHLIAATGDPRESAFLFQRLSIIIQRYNAVCVLGTFGNLAEDYD